MNVFELAAIINLDVNGYTSQLQGASKTTQSFGTKFGNTLKSAAKVGMAAITAVSTAVTAFAVSSIKTGETFDKSMSQVAATMGTTVDNIQELRDFAQEMGRTTAFTATQAADALNYMALAGYDANKSMAMLPNVLNLAAAGNMDLARASDMVTDTQTAFGIDIARTTKMVDEMAKAASTGNTSVSQLGEAFLVVGGLAKELNGGFITLADGTQKPIDGITEMEVVLTAMANAGIKGSEAGTHLRNMIMKLSSPTAEGTRQLEELGVAVFDDEGRMRSLKDIMSDLNGELSNLTQEEKIKAISSLFNARDLASAEALLGAVEQDWDKIGASILEAQGAAEKMAKTQLDNLAGDITLFKSALEGAQIAISDNLSPALREFVQIGTEGIQKITEGFEKGGLDGALDAFGNTLSKIVTKIIDTIPKIADAAIKLIEAFIDGLSKSIPKIAKAATTIVTNLVNGITKVLPKIIQTGIQIINKITEGIAKALPKIIPAVVKMINEITITFTKNIGQMVKLGGQILGGIIAGILKSIPELVKATPQIIAALFKGILEAFTSGIGGLIEGLLGGFDMFSNQAQIHFQEVIEKAHETIESWNELKEAQNSALKEVANESGYYEGLLSELERLTDENGKVKDGYEDRVNFIKNELQKYVGEEINLEEALQGSKQETINAIQRVIEAKKAEHILSAQEEAAMQAQKTRAELFEAQGLAAEKAKSLYQQYVDILNGPQSQGTPYALAAIAEQYQAQVTELGNIQGAIDETYNAEKIYQENSALMAQGTTEAYQQIADSVNSLGETYSTNLETRKTQIEEEIAMETENRDNLLRLYEETNNEWYNNEATAAQARLDNLQTNLNATQEAIDTNNQEILNKGEGWLGSFGDQASRSGIAYRDNLTGELKYLPDDLSTITSDAGTQADEGFKETSDPEGTASWYGEGFLGKLQAFGLRFLGLGQFLGSQLKSGANSSLGVSSPSKEAMKTMQWFAKGFEIQGEKEGKNIYAVGSELGSMLNDGFNDSMSGFALGTDFNGDVKVSSSSNETINLQNSLNGIMDRMDYMEDILYNAFSRVLSDGVDLRWNDRELTRLIKNHA